MKHISIWAARIAAVVLLYFFCDRNLNLGLNQSMPLWSIPVLIMLQVFVLYSFFSSAYTPAKYRTLRQCLALSVVILLRWEAIAQGFVYFTPWSIIFAEILKEMPYIPLLHVPVQIVFSIVFYHLERRKQVQAL